MLNIPQSTAHLVVFKAFLASDHVSEATGKTIAITISKNGGAFGNPAAGATNATEISSGWYKVSLGTSDTDTLGPLAVRGAVATIDDVGVWYQVVSATTGGATNLDAAISSRMATYTQPTGFLAATFPTTVASTTNITAGTITTATNVTTVNGLASGVITAASIATGAIDADALATDAVDEIVDAVWDEPLTGATHNVATSAGVRLRQISGNVITTGTAQAGTVNTITLANTASATNGTYDPSVIRLSGGTGIGQARLIIDYNGTSKVAVVDRDWRTTPDNTTTYDILAEPNLQSTNEGLAQAGAANSITLNSEASAISNTYTGQMVVIRTGTGQDQSRIITAYNGSTKVATVAEAWTTTPTSASGYMILHTGRTLTVAMNADVLTASALAADAVTEIAGGITVPPDPDVAEIKAKTDQLTFTVAGAVDSNIQRVNDVAVTGTGAVGDEWGP
jgi:hypothetical protein